jgi:flagellar hook-associated protein 2
MAQSQVLKSAYFTSHDEQVFSAGSFTIAVGSNSPVTVSIGESGGLIGDVGYAWGSRDSMAAVINAAGAGVTASVENDTYGYQLKLTSTATGASNTISLSANDDPFDGGDENLAMLAFAQTQAAKDASFTVSFNGGPASSTQTSPSNQNITSSEGVGVDIVASGTATITVTSAPSFAADTESMVAAATQAIQNYNALIGTAASHTATAGVAATATSLLDEVYSAATATYSGKTLLEGLAITVPGDATGTLTLDSALLETKFAADKSGSAAILSAFVDAIESIANSYLLGEKRAIWENAMIVEEVAMTNNMIDALVDGASGYLAKDIKLYVLQKSLESVGTPTGLPSPSISIFA